MLRLGIQGIKERGESGTFFGREVPFSKKTVFMQYNFHAKLGIDGAQVKVTQTTENAYRISVPEFKFIGYDKPTFKIAVEDGDVLSWGTPDIDTVDMVNEILNDDARQTYIDSNEEFLKEQTEIFYDTLITSIDPDGVTTFEFRS